MRRWIWQHWTYRVREAGHAALLGSWRRAHRVVLTIVAVVLVPVPTVAVALFTPGSATASLPVSAPEQRWLHASVGGEPMPDPRTATAGRVAAFFRTLRPGQGETLARRYPSVVGNLNGAPVSLRYRANAVALSENRSAFATWARRQPSRFVAYDPRDGGRVAEVFGDLARADRIAVLVPGVGVRLSDFNLPSPSHPYRSPRFQARALYDRAHRDAPGDRIAVVAWLGYQPPADLGRGAAREELAGAGATALAGFVDGLAAQSPGARISVVGHSYGTVVAGLAAHRFPRQVSDIVAVGSPGMGVETAAGLRTRARIWAGCAPGDWIADVPGVQLLGVGHGTSPVDPAFGAHVFGVRGVHAHDQYFTPGTGSLDNIAQIVAGNDKNVH